MATSKNKYEPIQTPGAIFRYKTSKKQEAFEYFVGHLCDWWIKANPDKNFEDNDLGLLKVMKLLFFTTASTIDRSHYEDKTKPSLLDTFGNWYARPYGHVEDDIEQMFHHLKGEFKRFTLTQQKVIIRKKEA